MRPRVLPPMFNVPNCLTLSRLFLAALFTWVLAIDVYSAPSQEVYAGWFVPMSTLKAIALWSFVVGAITDFFDGYLARKYSLVTNFGKLIDPLADKVLVCAAIIYLTFVGYCPFWVTIVIVTREFLVTGLRQLAVEQGEVIAADKFGKWKTVFQLTFCILCLIHIAYSASLPPVIRHIASGEGGEIARAVTLWASVILTLVSGVNYCYKARHLFK